MHTACMRAVSAISVSAGASAAREGDKLHRTYTISMFSWFIAVQH
jgi:hypothetical protein